MQKRNRKGQFVKGSKRPNPPKPRSEAQRRYREEQSLRRRLWRRGSPPSLEEASFPDIDYSGDIRSELGRLPQSQLELRLASLRRIPSERPRYIKSHGKGYYRWLYAQRAAQLNLVRTQRAAIERAIARKRAAKRQNPSEARVADLRKVWLTAKAARTRIEKAMEREPDYWIRMGMRDDLRDANFRVAAASTDYWKACEQSPGHWEQGPRRYGFRYGAKRRKK